MSPLTNHESLVHRSMSCVECLHWWSEQTCNFSNLQQHSFILSHNQQMSELNKSFLSTNSYENLTAQCNVYVRITYECIFLVRCEQVSASLVIRDGLCSDPTLFVYYKAIYKFRVTCLAFRFTLMFSPTYHEKLGSNLFAPNQPLLCCPRKTE